jgi:hypothetical protein
MCYDNNLNISQWFPCSLLILWSVYPLLGNGLVNTFPRNNAPNSRTSVSSQRSCKHAFLTTRRSFPWSPCKLLVRSVRRDSRSKLHKIGMICTVKPVLTEDLCVVQKEETFNNMLYVWNVHLTKCQACSWETNSSSRQRGCYIRTITAGVQLKKISGRGFQGAWRKDELIGGKPPVVK